MHDVIYGRPLNVHRINWFTHYETLNRLVLGQYAMKPWEDGVRVDVLVQVRQEITENQTYWIKCKRKQLRISQLNLLLYLNLWSPQRTNFLRETFETDTN
jgi:hypothetical protein